MSLCVFLRFSRRLIREPIERIYLPLNLREIYDLHYDEVEVNCLSTNN